MAEAVYRRVVIKLSGEYLAGAQAFGIDQQTVDRIAGELIAARELGAEIAVVLWPGVQFRTGQAFDVERIIRAARSLLHQE